MMKKKDKNNTNIRASGDPISSFDGLNPISTTIVIPNPVLNPVLNHKTDRLLDLPEDTVIGSGSNLVNPFKKEVDFKKVRKGELKTFLKTHKKALNINITGLKKKEMIQIIEKII
jgi:hypothetical protein